MYQLYRHLFKTSDRQWKTNLAQMTLETKEKIKLLEQKLYTLPFQHHAWLRQDLTYEEQV